MNFKAALIVLAILGWSSVSAQAAKFAYVIRIPRSASYQLLPGDYVRVDVQSGPDGQRVMETPVKKVQVIRISEGAQAVHLSLAMNRHEVTRLRQTLKKIQPMIVLQVVQTQPRGDIALPPGDGVEDLDMEETTDLAQKP